MIRGNILIVGLSTVDLRISKPFASPGADKRLEAEKYRFSAGGIGANTAIAISRLGWGSMLCTAIGDDMFGNTFSNIFYDERVEPRYIKVCRNAQTPIKLSLEDQKGGEVYIPSASRFIGMTDVETSFNVMPDAVITTLELPFDVVSTADRCTGAQGTKLILDSTGAEESTDISALKNIEIMVLSDKDLATLTGVTVKSIDDRMNGCIKLNAKVKIRYTIIDMEEKGYYIYDGKYCDFIMPFDDIPVVNSKCGREAFLAALTISYLRTDNIKSSVEFASAASAIARGREGSFESLPTEKEIRDYLKK